MLLELRNVEKEYKMEGGNKFKALKGINVSFDSGELVSIIGESGSGKSTLMNLIGGLDSEYTGMIKLEEKDISKFKEKELDKYRKNKVGFVFQSFNLIPHLSVLDNITIAMTLSNVRKSERIKRAEQLITEVGLKDHMHKKPNQLSGGQKQRVAIARALINNPDIILADEPTGSLDSETSEQILGIIREIARKGKLVIMVTHSEKVAAYSSRIVKITDGKIVSDEKRRELEEEVVNENVVVKKDRQNLSFGSAIKLALNNMKEKMARNILVSLGASIGIMSVVLMLSIGNGVEKYITDTMNGYVNPLVVEVNQKDDINSGEESMKPGAPITIMQRALKPFEQKDIDKLKKINHVEGAEKAYSVISFGTNKIKYKENEQFIQVVGTISSNITKENIKEGDYPKEYEVLISSDLADKYEDKLIGKTITLELKINDDTFLKDVVVSGIYGPKSSDNVQMTTIYMNYNDLEKVAKENDYELKPTTIYLTSDDKSYIEDIKTEIKTLGYQGSKQEQLLGMFTEMLDIITYILAAIAAISLVVSAIMILVVLYISVVERTREIGVLKAIGARRKDIKRIFVSESFLIGLVSGLIGVAGAWVLMILINSITNRMFSVPLVCISWYYVLFGIAVSIIISTFAGLFPASKASKLDPVESLRRE